MIDTQAEVSIVKVDAIEPHTIVATADKCNLSGITDGRIMSLGSIFADIYLSKNTKVSQKFQVVRPSFPIPTHGILGKDFIWKNSCTVCALTNSLIIRTYLQNE